MNKISADHLSRTAIVYIRQSTSEQLKFNAESRRRQYGLQERARALGWSDVVVIDEDLGRSGSGIVRPGFERLLATVCRGVVGAVLSIEASRLARNGRDWHTLLEFCGLVGTLIVDEDGVYDARLPNDRLLLGMKGTMSELELSLLRQRSHEAIKLKASRGELFTSVPVGYVRTERHRIEKDPDERVRAALDLVFGKFMELQSVRQVHLWLRQEQVDLPFVDYLDLSAGRTLAITAAARSSAKVPVTTAFTSVRCVSRRQWSRNCSACSSPRAYAPPSKPSRHSRASTTRGAINSSLRSLEAQFEASRAKRQYDAVDPENRLVAAELERRWNERLADQRRIEERIAVLDGEPEGRLTAAERERLMELGHDLEQAWTHPAARPEIRKRILRSVLTEIVVRVSDHEHIELTLHWRGGDHTRIDVIRNKTGRHRSRDAGRCEDNDRSAGPANHRSPDRRDPQPRR